MLNLRLEDSTGIILKKKMGKILMEVIIRQFIIKRSQIKVEEILNNATSEQQECFREKRWQFKYIINILLDCYTEIIC